MAVRFSGKNYAFNKPVVVEGRLVLEFTPSDVGSVSRYAWSLNPIQFGTTKVLDDLAHNFVWFRFIRLKPIIFAATTTAGEMTALSVATFPPVTPPADLESVLEQEFACAAFGGQTVPSYLELGKKALGQVQPKWFRVEPTGDDYLEYQGQLTWVDSAQTVSARKMVVEYAIEFLGLSDDSLTPRPLTRPGVEHSPLRLRLNRRLGPAGDLGDEDGVVVPLTAPVSATNPHASPRGPETANRTSDGILVQQYQPRKGRGWLGLGTR